MFSFLDPGLPPFQLCPGVCFDVGLARFRAVWLGDTFSLFFQLRFSFFTPTFSFPKLFPPPPRFPRNTLFRDLYALLWSAVACRPATNPVPRVVLLVVSWERPEVTIVSFRSLFPSFLLCSLYFPLPSRLICVFFSQIAWSLVSTVWWWRLFSPSFVPAVPHVMGQHCVLFFLSLSHIPLL